LSIARFPESGGPQILILLGSVVPHKVRQYLQAGVRAVWLLYRKTREAYRYVPEAIQPTVVCAERGGKFEEPELLPGFSLLLSEILP
jgi:Uma2 family endonuclease